MGAPPTASATADARGRNGWGLSPAAERRAGEIAARCRRAGGARGADQAKWQAAQWPGFTSRSSGSSREHTSWAM